MASNGSALGFASVVIAPRRICHKQFIGHVIES
jgi:hypothetical protein